MAASYTYSFFAKDYMSSAFMKMAQSAQRSFSKINKNYADFKNNNQKTGKSINDLRVRLEKFRQKRDASFSVREIRRFNGYIRKTERQLRKLENLPPLSFRQRLSMLSGKMGGMIGIAGGIGAALAAWSGIKGVINLGAEMEQTRVSFTTMLGSAEKADVVLGKLNKFANKTPYSNAEVIKSGRSLLSFGITAEKLEPTLKSIGDVASGLKIPFNELSQIYGKIKVQNTVYSEDLNQLAGRGIPIFDELAKVMGVQSSEVKKLASQGKITFPYIEQAFQNMTGKGAQFYNLMDAQSKTFSGRLSTLKGKLQTIAIKIGERLLPVAGKLVDWGLKFVNLLQVLPQKLQEFKQFIDENAVSIGLLAGAVTLLSYKYILGTTAGIGYSIATKAVAIATGIFSGAMKVLNFIMNLNPAIAIASAILALGAAMVWAYKKVDWFRGGMQAGWTALKEFGTLLKDLVINRIKELIKGIAGIGKTLMYFFKGEWKKAWQTGKQATKDLIGAGTAKQAVAGMKEIGRKSAAAYQKGVNEIRYKDFKPGKKLAGIMSYKPGKKSNTPGVIDTGEGVAGLQDGNQTDTQIQKGINSISGGGKKQTNINIHFDKMIEQLILTTSTLNEGIDEIEDKLKAILLRILNSANQMQLSNG